MPADLNDRDARDVSPLLDSYSRQSPLASPLSLSSSSSSSGTLKQYALIFLAVCVVGYLSIVLLEISPLASPHAVLSGFSFSSSSPSPSAALCHAHYHETLDEPLTMDERIDHLLYRTLKLAIDNGDDEQAANVAKELARARSTSSDHTVSRPQASSFSRSRGPALRRKKPPTQVDVEEMKAQVEAEIERVLHNRTAEEWQSVYADEATWSSFLHRPHYHLGAGWRFSAPGCLNLDGQCSLPSKDAARDLCTQLDECRGFVCNHQRTDCQLRVAPLVHDGARRSFDAYYKAATDLASADVRTDVRRRLEVTLMAPGSTAAPDFDFAAPCSPTFKCVISYGLYGSSPKYGDGAIENAKLVSSVFPGWVARFYHDSSVPQSTLDSLVREGGELVFVDSARADSKLRGDIAGMFWRFLVAEDDTVQRFLVRDSDSRLNPREAAAVQEWLVSGYSVHTLRDHPNHDRQLNGGMWGGVRGSVQNIRSLIQESSLNGYGADLSFLGDKVWPAIQYDQLGHDAYTCEKWINSRSFPTKRPDDYQHVGQVFENGHPRMGDVTGFMVGVEVPKACRREPDWKFG